MDKVLRAVKMTIFGREVVLIPAKCVQVECMTFDFVSPAKVSATVIAHTIVGSDGRVHVLGTHTLN